ncbi:hydrolase [Microbacterium bovistercoris]|uniref:Hydrolase n=1 Tax=Microbacterium bovistercoris TaxID=2293570 RepID=A0A371NX89_9MICO|nr:hydrolase [Microbacterium bovistercoris]REJ07826.1 hydrolase [Microbacterium bovistercoris]
MIRAVRFYDGRMLRDGMLVDGRLVAEPASAGTPALDGIVTGRFTDHHVHLQLVDPALLAGSRLGRVVDLGANVDAIRALASALEPRSARADAARPTPRKEENAASPSHEAALSSSHPGEPNRADTDGSRAGVTVEYAGPFLTAIGGYPSDREWAPEGSVIELRDAAHAASVVAGLAAAGVSCLKTVGNSDAGPVLDDDLFRELARLAATHRLPLVAHAEGVGQAQRAARLGATRLAHSPFTELLTDDEVAAQAASVSWVSTMAIHDGEQYANVVDNVRRFAAAGGELVYGSDMGNGPTPVDLRESEVAALREAGVDGLALLRTLAPGDPLGSDAPLLFLPEGDPARATPLTEEESED